MKRRKRSESSCSRSSMPASTPVAAAAAAPCPLRVLLLAAATMAFQKVEGFNPVPKMNRWDQIKQKPNVYTTTTSNRYRREMSYPFDSRIIVHGDPLLPGNGQRSKGQLQAVAFSPASNGENFWQGRDNESQMPSPIGHVTGRKSRENISADVGSTHARQNRQSQEHKSKEVALDEGKIAKKRDGKSKSKNNSKKNSGGNRRKIRQMFRQARDLERTGQWRESTELLREILSIDPQDAHSHLALARLGARREGTGPQVEGRRSPAREAFRVGTEQCPDSVHLWQAWAVHEQSRGNEDQARDLFSKALDIDDQNPYVCHAFGLMEQRAGNLVEAQNLWEKGLRGRSTAALVCSLGELYSSSGRHSDARKLYDAHVNRVQSERETTEIYLAASWLEERHFGDMDRAAELLQMALKRSPGNSRAQVALARLEGRRANRTGKNVAAMRKSLEEACTTHVIGEKSSVRDGRLFNAWAKLEVKAGNPSKARAILKQGIREFPSDQSLLQAAGKVEERLGNYSRARDMYSSSLSVEPSAPTLVAYALLELKHPENKPAELGIIRKLFEEALLLEPRHGPAYNAYGNMEFQQGNVDRARDVFQRGVKARCTDAASVYHGLGQLELSLGNVKDARKILRKGMKEVELHEDMMETNQLKRAVFLAHTLGMLELNSNRVEDARKVFEKGLARHPNSSRLLLGAALCEVKLGKEDEARKYFERAINKDRKHAQAWQAWAVMEMRAGDYKVAKTLLECGIKEVPTHGALWQAYGTMESRRSNFNVARTLFAAGIQKCPNHVPLYQGWACLELRGKHYDRAKILITEALTRDKKQGLGWLVSARIEEKQGNDGLAAMILRRGLECAPHDASLYCALGELEVRRGHIDNAREVFEEGLSIDPLHAPLYHSLAELEAIVFNLDGLAKLNRRAAEVFNTDALQPSPASAEAWGNKIKRAGTNSTLPEGVAALAAMVRPEEDLDIEASLSNINPALLIEDIASHKAPKSRRNHDAGPNKGRTVQLRRVQNLK